MVILLNRIRRSEGLFWGISNFLTKLKGRETITLGDVEHVRSKLVMERPDINLKYWTDWTQENEESFLEIKKPEKLGETLNKEKVMYCLLMAQDELRDVSDLYLYLLLKLYFKEEQICLLISGDDRGYYTDSDFFSSVLRQDEDFYNSFFYHAQGEPYSKRFVKDGERAYTSFLPIEIIDRPLYEFLAGPLYKQIPEDWIADLLKGHAVWEEVKNKDLLYGSMRLLEKRRKLFDTADSMRISSLIANGTVLGGLLLTFSIKTFMGDKRQITPVLLADYLEQLEEYSKGCLQLIENVLFHSKSQSGIFSFRLCREEKRYLSRKYGTEAVITGTDYVEVLIADYVGENSLRNMAENFLDNIQDRDIREKFNGMSPCDFFQLSKNRTMELAWKAYYSDPDNLGKHFGLRIFESVIENCKGRFLLQSHGSHSGRNGETYNYLTTETLCYPGTSYAVLLPLRELQRQLTFAEIGIDKDADTRRNIKDSGKYRIVEQGIDFGSGKYTSQQEKNALICGIADEMEAFCIGNPDTVRYLCAQGWNGSYGEILCKAVLMAGHNTAKMSHMVFYNCSKELIAGFISAMLLIFKNSAIEYAIKDKDFQVALFSEDNFEQTIIFPGNYVKTVAVNERHNFSKGTFASWMGDLRIDRKKFRDIDIGENIPFELLHEIEIAGVKQTIFEHYAEYVIKKDIQERAFGCHISHTHMRLGSTIHVDSFYEAELLFGSQLFISGFAFLLMRQLQPLIQEDRAYTVYGYATYSELLVFEIMQLMKDFNPSVDVDYVILEREIEQRGDSHVDRIRYSKEFTDRGQRMEYFSDRQIFCIIPISSTLKTNEKMLNIFCEENGENCRLNIMENFSLVLVGTEGENEYWTLNDEKRIVGKENINLFKSPRYFVEVTLRYEEASACKMCYPANILDEKPLIEVNASSTIPNQAFGLYPLELKADEITWDNIKGEEDELSVLEDCLIYSHVKRGENHYLHYFQTDKLMIQQSGKIKDWLGKIEQAQAGEYHVIFCPMHFSNAGFLEYINKTVFHDAAIIIRDDIDKVYRRNIIAKYSNLQLLMERMAQYGADEEMILKFYYVDDSIITGRTFYRSKSLIESIINMYAVEYPHVKAHIFEKIFVLVDRNSKHSRMQYIRCWDSARRRLDHAEQDYYAFRSVDISSIRNHGDSCILCKLEEEAGILQCTASTKQTAEYWKQEREKFRVKTLKEYLKGKEGYLKPEQVRENSEIKRRRGVRRMVCTHIATKFLNENVHGNKTPGNVLLILKLLITDFSGRRENRREAVEYFFSYLKVLSRPFLSFQKSSREAIFDILLVLMEHFLTDREMGAILDEMQDTKEYVGNEEISSLYRRISDEVIPCIFSENQQKNYFTILMKQLSELKSNYIIRLENMNKIAGYIDNLEPGEQECLYKLYMEYVKKLVGVSSDTSKSAWLDSALHNHREPGCTEAVRIKLPDKVQEKLYLENTRVFYDGIKKLSIKYGDLPERECDEFQASLQNVLKEYQFGNFNKLLKEYVVPGKGEDGCIRSIMSCVQLMQLIEKEFQKAEPDEKDKDEKEMLEKCNHIIRLMCKILQADYVMLIMEIPSEHEQWRKVLADSCNEWFHGTGCGNRINIPQSIENLVLTNSRDGYDKIQEFDKDIAGKLQAYRENPNRHCDGYAVNTEENFLIWEMESRPQYPMYIYAKLRKDLEHWEKMNNIRNVMMYYHLLNTYVFSYHNSSQLHELIIRARDVQLMNYDKAHIHTGYEARMRQVERACRSNMEGGYYRSNNVTLLADIKVSEIFRKSLKSDYYTMTSRVQSVPWDSDLSPFNNGAEVYATGHEDASVIIDVQNTPIMATDKKLDEKEGILCYIVSNGAVESFLLIYAMIQNAGITGRSGVTDGKIEVHLSKTEEGNLRICNRLSKDNKKVDIDEINANIRLLPSDGAQGISLWSVSRYLQGLQYAMLQTCLSEWKEGTETMDERRQEEFRAAVQEVINGGYEISAECVENGEAEYFSIEIPILSSRYRQSVNAFRFEETK